WVRAGEWLIYTVNVQAPGQYTATFRAANPDAASKPVEIYLDGARIGTVQIGTTGAFTTFKNFATTLTFPAAGKHQIRLAFPATRLNVNYIDFASGGTVTTTTGAPVVTTTSATTPTGGATFTAAPNPVAKSSLIRFTLVPAPGKYVRSVWWTFDKDDHYGTWNSRNLNPAFFYPKSGKYTPLVKITYTDGSTETVERVDYVTVSQ
ncbi:MAG: carbohydrate-binding protein, partial [Methanospirillum sp.]|nr:carbohydrate-binding protein [Methanospirillum sp.]